jgi:DNA polymerase V
MRFYEPPARTGQKQIRLPLFSMPVSAGSPKPADEYVEEILDLSRLLVKRPEATFFVRVEGESMIEAEIHPGDLLVVDRSVEPRHKDIVIAIVDGEFTVKVLQKKPDLRLVSRNAAAPTKIEEPFEIWGVVLWVVHKAR